MNKLLKASIASAAGVALLLGGAGTFAYWNSAATLDGGTIIAGNLLVSETDPTSAGVWTVNGGTAAITISSYRVVPGDVLKYTKKMHIVATGDNLVATLGVTPSSIVASTSTTANNSLAALLSNSAVLSVTNATGIVAVAGETNKFTVTAGSAGVDTDVTVTATITFPKVTADATGVVAAGFENAAKLGSVSLQNFTITLAQTLS
ncbi:MAG: alternate-type signal peptide domain-containing protein [Burkholderiaceae bacterium]|nr:alternate-type signal peptide domain-containing protein [Microbacteriaceae bacterium]